MDVMTRRVVTAGLDDSIDSVVSKMSRYNISGLPVVDDRRRVIGLITADDISRRLYRRFLP